MESKQRDHENAMKEQKENMDAKIARVSKIKIKSYARVITLNGVASSGPTFESARATQLRRNVATVTSRLRHCVRFDRPGI